MLDASVTTECLIISSRLIGQARHVSREMQEICRMTRETVRDSQQRLSQTVVHTAIHRSGNSTRRDNRCYRV
jgi:hypothetical protein